MGGPDREGEEGDQTVRAPGGGQAVRGRGDQTGLFSWVSWVSVSCWCQVLVGPVSVSVVAGVTCWCVSQIEEEEPSQQRRSHFCGATQALARHTHTRSRIPWCARLVMCVGKLCAGINAGADLAAAAACLPCSTGLGHHHC